MKKVLYPTKAQSKNDIATDVYLAERIIDFFWLVKHWNWSWHQFWPCTVNHTPKYNANIEGGLYLSSKRYHKAARRFHGVYKKETKFSWCR